MSAWASLVSSRAGYRYQRGSACCAVDQAVSWSCIALRSSISRSPRVAAKAAAISRFGRQPLLQDGEIRRLLERITVTVRQLADTGRVRRSRDSSAATPEGTTRCPSWSAAAVRDAAAGPSAVPRRRHAGGGVERGLHVQDKDDAECVAEQVYTYLDRVANKMARLAGERQEFPSWVNTGCLAGHVAPDREATRCAALPRTACVGRASWPTVGASPLHATRARYRVHYRRPGGDRRCSFVGPFCRLTRCPRAIVSGGRTPCPS